MKATTVSERKVVGLLMLLKAQPISKERAIQLKSGVLQQQICD